MKLIKYTFRGFLTITRRATHDLFRKKEKKHIKNIKHTTGNIATKTHPIQKIHQTTYCLYILYDDYRDLKWNRKKRNKFQFFARWPMAVHVFCFKTAFFGKKYERKKKQFKLFFGVKASSNLKSFLLV